MKGTIKLGIVGFGFMGGWHVSHAGTMDEVEITAICDIDPDKLTKAPAGIPTYTDYRELLKNPNVNTVMVTVPNHLHLQVAVDAANAGKHLIVEKPVALDTREFDIMEAAARKNNIVFSIDQNRRWDSDYLEVKQTLEEGLLGDVFSIESRLYGSFGLVHDWHTKKEFGGGMLYDWGVHFLDQMLDLIPSKVTSVFADLRSVINEEVDDFFVIMLNFENGVTARISLGTFMLQQVPRWYIGGSKGTMIVKVFPGDGDIYRVREMNEKLPDTPINTSSGPTRTFSANPTEHIYTDPIPTAEKSWNCFFTNYANVLEGKEELIVTPQQARRVLKLMEACRESSRLRKSVEFE